MKLPRRRFLHLAASAAAVPTLPRIAQAQAYPTRPVRIIVGFAPGQAIDIVTRIIGQWLSEQLGQQFIIENRPGAGGNIATEAVVRAPPIVGDEDVDPFDMKQVMWAVSTKVNPAGDVIMLPNMSIDVLDPASQPDGISHKMVIDATTPVPPDDRGSFGEQLGNPPQTDAWRTKLGAMLKDLHK